MIQIQQLKDFVHRHIMRSLFRALAILLCLALSEPARAGVLLRLFYDLIPGGGVQQLRRSPMFPDHPTRHQVMTGAFDEPESSGGEIFGSYNRGFIEAPQTGLYTFWISSDDGSELWLSTNHEPKNIHRLAGGGPIFILDPANPTQRAWPIAPKSDPVP